MLLLQVTLAQVLQLTLGEFKLGRRSNGELRSVSGDGDIVASQSAGLVSDLDTVVQVLLERSNIEDLIVDWLCAVNDELDGRFLSLDLLRRAGELSANCWDWT